MNDPKVGNQRSRSGSSFEVALFANDEDERIASGLTRNRKEVIDITSTMCKYTDIRTTRFVLYDLQSRRPYYPANPAT